MRRRGFADRVFDGTLGAIGVLGHVVLFFGFWVFGFAFLLLVSLLAGIAALWPAALGATLAALFLTWLSRRILYGLVDGTIDTFGNHPKDPRDE